MMAKMSRLKVENPRCSPRLVVRELLAPTSLVARPPSWRDEPRQKLRSNSSVRRHRAPSPEAAVGTSRPAGAMQPNRNWTAQTPRTSVRGRNRNFCKMHVEISGCVPSPPRRARGGAHHACAGFTQTELVSTGAWDGSEMEASMAPAHGSEKCRPEVHPS